MVIFNSYVNLPEGIIHLQPGNTVLLLGGVVTVKRMTRQFDRNGMAMFRWRCLDRLADSGRISTGFKQTCGYFWVNYNDLTATSLES